jgi:hypothetical protein
MKKIILSLLLLGVLFGQVNDKSFKEKISDGVVIVVFTSKWAESDGMEYVEGISGHEEAIIIKAMSENTKKICKKLRLRNFPSIALFINGDKADTWKADMDGIIDITPKDIKKAIDAGIAGDVF